MVSRSRRMVDSQQDRAIGFSNRLIVTTGLPPQWSIAAIAVCLGYLVRRRRDLVIRGRPLDRGDWLRPA
jgi:hypothetical protein